MEFTQEPKSYCKILVCFDLNISQRLSAVKMEPDSSESPRSCQKSLAMSLPWIWYPGIPETRYKADFLTLICFQQGRALQSTSAIFRLYFPFLTMGNFEIIFFLLRIFFSSRISTKGHFCFQVHPRFCFFFFPSENTSSTWICQESWIWIFQNVEVTFWMCQGRGSCFWYDWTG